MTETEIRSEAVEQLYQRLKKEGEEFGYYLNPEVEFTRDLVKSLLINESRYGYMACPCRLASGEKGQDLDIVCPCDYRDKDLDEYGTCFCGLYVSAEAAQGMMKIGSIPERRPDEKSRKNGNLPSAALSSQLARPVWRCKVCGYLCARDEPPGICPICKVPKDRFELFIAGGQKRTGR